MGRNFYLVRKDLEIGNDVGIDDEDGIHIGRVVHKLNFMLNLSSVFRGLGNGLPSADSDMDELVLQPQFNLEKVKGLLASKEASFDNLVAVLVARNPHCRIVDEYCDGFTVEAFLELVDSSAPERITLRTIKDCRCDNCAHAGPHAKCARQNGRYYVMDWQE